MIEERVKAFSEALARGMERRTFLKRVGGTIVGGIAALAVGPAFAEQASKKPGASIPNVPSCAPPGPYCNLNGVNEPNGCLNSTAPNFSASCFQHRSGGTVYSCQVYYQYYTTGCWTTSVAGGYWTCCDCQCTNGSTCGCASFNPASSLSPH